jgi:hypothetical protein
MKIIHLPGAPTEASTSLDPNHRMALGPVSFTCTSCGEHTQVDFHRMVFRSLEFWCLGCGTPFRVVNPAFSGCGKKIQ